MHKHGGDIYTYKNCIDFSANINPLGMPERVRKAAEEGLSLCANYPDPLCRKLREAIGKREQVDSSSILCGNGAADLIFSLVLAVKPKRALVMAPSFYEYEQALRTVDCQVCYYYLREEGDFHLREDLLLQITEDTDMVFLCNPNNPTGVLTERELLLKILRQCEKKDALLVVDECFIEFLEQQERYTIKDEIGSSSHLFVLRAFTKMYAMAGLRLGYCLCGNLPLLEKMQQNRQPWSVSIPAQMAGIAAVEDAAFAEESRQTIARERQQLKTFLQEMGFRVLDGAANYLCFQGAEGLSEYCRDRGILIRDCSNYEGLCPGWYRVAVKSRADNAKLMEVLGGWK